MGAFDKSPPDLDRRGYDFIDSQNLETDCGTDDIHDGVDRPHFMKMDLVDGVTVDLCLGFGNFYEDIEACALDPLGKITFLYEPGNILERPVPMTVRCRRALSGGEDHVELCAENATPLVSFHLDLVGTDFDLPQFFSENLRIDTQIDHGAEIHISADAGKTIVVQDFQDSFPRDEWEY
jgi:hypothetical protein